MINKFLVSSCIVMIFTILFIGCKQDPAGKFYAVELALDKGEYDKAIELLDGCTAYSGDDVDLCNLYLGSAQFSKAKFDFLSIAKELKSVDDENLSKDQQTSKINQIIFSKFDNNYISKGIDAYKKVLGGNSDKCNANKYYNGSFTRYEKKACLAINPFLLFNKNDDTNRSQTATTLDNIIRFKDVISSSVPELKFTNLNSILFTDKNASNKDDLNNNGIYDGIDVTSYVLNSVKNNNWTPDNNLSQDSNKTDAYSGVFDNLDYYKIKLTTTNSSKYFYRVVTTLQDGNKTIVSTIPNKVCSKNNYTIDVPYDNINGSTYFPCLKLDANDKPKLLSDAVETLNNSSVLQSIAVLKDLKDDQTSDENKILNLKKELCNITGDPTSTNEGICKVDSSNNITLTQNALISYLDGK